MNEQSVRIGPEFFAKIKLDYADWRWALVREFLQNSIDAPGSKRIDVTVEAKGGGTVLTVANDGEPMDEATLTGKLLILGGSGKNFEGENTGGFGVAKSLLYYCHERYRIETGPLTVTGEGAQYRIERGEAFAGTRSRVVVHGDERQRLIDACRKFAAMCQWRGELRLNGELLATDLRKGARRKDLGWAVVYTNKSYANTCIVRLNGQPMFSMHTRFAGCVLLELTGKACSTLTSNRDGLVYPYRSELATFLTDIAVDKRSALREKRTEYKRYQGEVQRNKTRQPQETEGLAACGIDVGQLAKQLGGTVELVPSGTVEQVPGEQPQQEVQHESSEAAPPRLGGIKLVVASTEDAPKEVTVGPQFILKNTLGLKTPAWYVPGEQFSKYSTELVRVWTRLLLKLHQIMERDGEFSVGFILDEENEAEHEQGPYGKVYYLNPCQLVEGEGKRRLEKRYENAWENRCELIALACHEFVHGAYGLGQHDEDYANVLTEVVANAMHHMHDLVQLCRPAPASQQYPQAMPLKR